MSGPWAATGVTLPSSLPPCVLALTEEKRVAVHACASFAQSSHPWPVPCLFCIVLIAFATLCMQDYLIPAWHAEAWPTVRTRALFFDMGASLYHTGNGGASMSWFVNQYRARGISFDRIFAWEAKQYTDATIYATMPPSIVDRISYYNVPANTTPGTKHNPWRTLRAVATPKDFVVVKIDIDNTPVEEALLEQLLADSALSSLVDEFYFEHHVLNTPMWHYGWKRDTVTTHTLVHSYDIFSQLRVLGIRAHSWV